MVRHIDHIDRKLLELECIFNIFKGIVDRKISYCIQISVLEKYLIP